MEITPEEREIIINELLERFQDLVHLNGRKQAEAAFERIKDIISFEHRNDWINIIFQFDFVINDIIQILGRNRRVK